jgi:hypothetical protein
MHPTDEYLGCALTAGALRRVATVVLAGMDALCEHASAAPAGIVVSGAFYDACDRIKHTHTHKYTYTYTHKYTYT